MRVLILGGTGEARELAERLTRQGVDVISSLAGRTAHAVQPPGEVRTGGFGTADELAAFLRAADPSVVIDATHPFAREITEHAVRAGAATATPLLVLRRPGWTAGPQDDWTRVPSVAAAAAHVRDRVTGTVFLTTGRRDLAAFADDDSHPFLVRSVDPPTGRTPPRMTLVLDRGPYRLAAELALMRTHRVDVLVTKDSGGSSTSAKLAAAGELGRPVIMIDRPSLPDGVTALESVDAVLSRLDATT